MKELIIDKASKLKFSADVFISIVVSVFMLGMAWSSINAKQNQMITKIDEIVVSQKELVVIRDAQHSELSKQLGYLMPTVEMLVKKINL